MAKKVAETNRKGRYCPDCGFWNKPERKSCTNCEAVLPKRYNELGNKIAFMALIIAVLSIFLGAWDAYQAERTVHTNIKPILDIGTIEDKDGKISLILRNYGLGPAVITDVQIYKNGQKFKDLRSVLANLQYNAPYAMQTLGYNSYIHKDQEIILAEMSPADLKQKNYDETQIHEIIKSWRESLNETTIKIAYEDILGENQPTLHRTTRFHYKK